MIIQTDEDLQIGDIRQGLFDKYCRWQPDVRLMILAKSTREEYIQYCEEQNTANRIGSFRKNYYRVSID